MTANLFGERFLGNRTPAWHGLGKTFDQPITAQEAIELCNMGYQIIKAPLSAQVQTPFGTQLVTVEDKVMLLREPTSDDPQHLYLGIASPDYEIVQNSDVAMALDALTDIWPLETMGALDKGKTMFASLDAGEVLMHGEKIHQFFLATNTSDGGTSMKIAFTPVRVVCQNTLVTGLASATVSASLSHKKGIVDSMSERMSIMRKLQKASETTLQNFEALASAALDETGTRIILDETFPLPVKPRKVESVEGIDESDISLLGSLWAEASAANQEWEYYCQRQIGFQNGVKELFGKINDEYPDIANTPWAMYNAVVEFADYRRGSETTQQSALFGTRAGEKKRAFKAAMSLVK